MVRTKKTARYLARNSPYDQAHPERQYYPPEEPQIQARPEPADPLIGLDIVPDSGYSGSEESSDSQASMPVVHASGRNKEEEEKQNYARTLEEQQKRQDMIDSFNLPKFHNDNYQMYVKEIDDNLQFVFMKGMPEDNDLLLDLILHEEDDATELKEFGKAMGRANWFMGRKVKVDRAMVDQLMQKFGDRYVNEPGFDWTDPFKQSLGGVDGNLQERKKETMERIDYCNSMAYQVLVEYLLLEDPLVAKRYTYHYYKYKAKKETEKESKIFAQGRGYGGPGNEEGE